MNFVFGYGSLINVFYRHALNPRLTVAFPALLSKDAGLRVAFNTMLRLQGIDTPIRGAGVEYGEGRQIVGVLIPVDNESLSDLDAIEIPEYKRILVDSSLFTSVFPLTDVNIFMYVPMNESIPTGGVSFAYLTLLYHGAYQYGNVYISLLKSSLTSPEIVDLDFQNIAKLPLSRI